MLSKIFLPSFLALGLILLSAAPALGDTFDWNAFSTQKFQVNKFDDKTLIIRGNIDEGAYQEFKTAFTSKIKTVHISGGGGQVTEAVKIGLDLSRSGADVIVDGPCLSSCANYLFLAGKHKSIEGDGFVAFHGSPWHGGLLTMGRQSMNEFIDHRKIDRAMQDEINRTLKSNPNISMEDISKSLNGSYPSMLRNNREFFEKVGASDRLIENSVLGKFAETLPECHGVQPLSASEKQREPFLFVTIKQLSAYGVKGLSGTQNWNLAYESAQLISRNKRDDNSTIFCVDAYDRNDWMDTVSQIGTAPSSPGPNQTPSSGNEGVVAPQGAIR
jgi:hypothetical protein